MKQRVALILLISGFLMVFCNENTLFATQPQRGSGDLGPTIPIQPKFGKDLAEEPSDGCSDCPKAKPPSPPVVHKDGEYSEEDHPERRDDFLGATLTLERDLKFPVGKNEIILTGGASNPEVCYARKIPTSTDKKTKSAHSKKLSPEQILEQEVAVFSKGRSFVSMAPSLNGNPLTEVAANGSTLFKEMGLSIKCPGVHISKIKDILFKYFKVVFHEHKLKEQVDRARNPGKNVRGAS